MPSDTAAALVGEGRSILEQALIETAALDARLLLQHAVGLTHEDLIAEPNRLVSDKAAQAYRSMIGRRGAHEPVSRIVGSREFYGRSFRVTSAVLDPRADTETLVEAALSILPQGEPCTVLDLGTGSGAIIVTLLAERPLARGVATDLSSSAVEVASGNALRHGVGARLTLVETSWWQELNGDFDLIVSNPPYIPNGAIARLPKEVRDFDPTTALDGGPDGYEAYRRIAAGARPHLASGGRILVEIGEGQINDVQAIFERHGLAPIGQWADLASRIRCLGFSCR
jgi:release factor glutamine methyltransferase